MMATEIAKVSQFQTIGDGLIVSMTAEVTDITAVLEEQYPVSAIPADLSVKENYALVKSAISAIKKPRIALEKDRKSISAVPFNLCKKINAAAKPISESLVALESAWKEKKVEYDDEVEEKKIEKVRAEEERNDGILAKIETIKMAPIVNMDKSSTELQVILETSKADSFNLSWAMEYVETAQDTIAATIERLKTLITAKMAQEEFDRQQKEASLKLEADKKAAEDKVQAEREEQDRKNKEDADRIAEDKAVFEREKEEFRKTQEANDAAAKKIEDKRISDIKKEDDIRTAKIEAEKEEARKVEDARIAKIKREDDERTAKLKAEEDKKAAEAKAKAEKEEAEKQALLDEENRSARMGEASAPIQAILDSDDGECTAFDIVAAIIDGKVPHVTFK